MRAPSGRTLFRQLAAEASTFDFADLELGRETLDEAEKRVSAFLDELYEALATFTAELHMAAERPEHFEEIVDALWLIDLELQHQRKSLQRLASATSQDSAARLLEAAVHEPGRGLQNIVHLLGDSVGASTQQLEREALDARGFLMYALRRISQVGQVDPEAPERINRIVTHRL